MGRATRKDTSKTSSLLDVSPAPPGQRATPEQLAEMLRELRKLLGIDTEEGQQAVRELSQRLSQLRNELSQQLSPLQKSGSPLRKFFKRGFSLAPLIPLFPRNLPIPAAKPEWPKQPPAIPAVPVRLKSAKEWVPEVVKPVRDKLVPLGTT